MNLEKRCFFIFTAIFFAIPCISVAQQPALETENLVKNPGFEAGEQPWGLNNWMKNEVVVERDKNNPHSGKWALKVQLVKAINAPTVMYAYPHLGIKPNAAFMVKFWARGVSNGANLTVMMRKEVDPRPTYLRTEMNLTDEWQQYAFVVQLPSDADSSKTSLRFALNQIGVFWVDDIAVVELPPADNSAVSAINPIRNPSFEAGSDGWTALFRKREFGTPSQESGCFIPAPEDARLNVKTGNTAPNGSRFLSFTIDENCRSIITSAYFNGRYGHKANLSFFIRSNAKHSFQVGVGGGKNFSASFQLQRQETENQWQKISVPITLKPAQDGLYFVTFRFGEPGTYDIDAVSYAEEGQTLTDSFPCATAIQALPNAPVANLFAPKENASFKLVVAAGKPEQAKRYQLSAIDYLDRKVFDLNIDVKLDAYGYGEKTFTVPTAKQGAFRIEARQADDKLVLAEQIYSVLPLLPPPAERPDSYFGGHVDFSAYNLAIARKAGFRWLRMWPPLATTWMAEEPKPGVWNFQTETVANAAKQGFSILGMLGTAPDFKADSNGNGIINRWSKAYPPKKINEWKEYVAKSLDAYYPNIKTWEVWNEPDGNFLLAKPGLDKAAIYTGLIKAAREVVDSFRKPAVLLGPAVADFNSSFSWGVLQKGANNYMDAFTFHYYNLAAGGGIPDNDYILPILAKIKAYKNRFGETMPLWHSEGGMYLQGGQSWLATYRIPPSSATKPQAAAAMIRAALLFKAIGVKRYFDFELSATAAGRTVYEDATTGFIEVTGIPGPAVAAHAAMVSITEDADANGFEDLKFGTVWVKVAHFKSGKQTVDAYWSTSPISLKDVVKLSPQNTVLDMMGNPVEPQNAGLSEYPIYIIENGTN